MIDKHIDPNAVHIKLYLDKVKDFCRSQQLVVEHLTDVLKLIDSSVTEEEVDFIYNRVLIKDDCEDYKHYDQKILQDKVEYIKFKTSRLVDDYKYYLESDFKTSMSRLEVLLKLLTRDSG